MPSLANCHNVLISCHRALISCHRALISCHALQGVDNNPLKKTMPGFSPLLIHKMILTHKRVIFLLKGFLFMLLLLIPDRSIHRIEMRIAY